MPGPSTRHQWQRPKAPPSARPQLTSVLLVVLTAWSALAPARLVDSAAPPISPAGPPAAAVPEVSTGVQMVAAIGDNAVAVVRLIANVLVKADAWPSAMIVRRTNFTILGAEWYPILDLVFVEAKVHLEPGATFIFGQLELRNVRTRSGFELDVFSSSPNATVRYDHSVYFCYSCLPLDRLVNAASLYTLASAELEAVSLNWTRPQAALAETYGNGQVLLFRKAAAVLPSWEVRGATSGGGYHLNAINTVFVCQNPVNLTTCDSRGLDYCLSNRIEALYAVDDTWARLAAAAVDSRSPPAGGGDGSISDGRSGGGGESKGSLVGVAVGAAVGGATVLAAVTVGVVLYRVRGRRRRRRGGGAAATNGKCTAAVAAAGAPGDGDGAMLMSSHGDGEAGSVLRAVKVEACKSLITPGCKGGGSPQDDLSSPIISEEDLNHPQAEVKLQVAATAPPAAAASQMPSLPACKSSAAGGGPGGSGAAAAAGAGGSRLDSGSTTLTSSRVPQALIAGAGGTQTHETITTLGESFHPWSDSSCLAVTVNGGGARAPLVGGVEERGQPAVEVAGITIELMNAIGTGSFGKVFRGAWQGRPVAVKVLQYGADLCRAVHNEVLLSQTLRHPNVVAALFFAQVLPGGRLGLQTSGGMAWQGGGGDGGAAAAAAAASAATAAASRTAGEDGRQQGSGGGKDTHAVCCSRFIVTGTAPHVDIPVGPYALAAAVATESTPAAGPAVAMAAGAAVRLAALGPAVVAGGGSGGSGGRFDALQGGLHSARPCDLGAPTAAAAAAPPPPPGAAVARPRHEPHFKSPAASPQMSLHADAADAARLWGYGDAASTSASGGASASSGACGGDASRGGSGPLSWIRPSDRCTGDVRESAASGSHATSEGDGGGAAAAAAGRRQSYGESDVLSRWDEQRRCQALVEENGAKLIGPEMVVTSKGFVVQAADSRKELAAAPAAPASALSGGTVAAPMSAAPTASSASPATGSVVGADSSARRLVVPQQLRRSNNAAAPSTLADAAAAALPLEALWLAAHTHPSEGSSHGFLVMELCEGGTAVTWRSARWQGDDQRPDLAVLLRLALDIAYGMSYIHSMGICHGDLKLSNVLLARSGGISTLADPHPTDSLEGWVAKVCDFGLSRVLTNDRTHVSTRPYGTPTHMAPELWTKGHMSQPADVYAFGITLWELATGERPYKGLNAARILHLVLLNGGRPGLPPWLPPSYTRLVSSCWAQSPKDRPTFGEIVRHLEAMLAVLAAVTPGHLVPHSAA